MIAIKTKRHTRLRSTTALVGAVIVGFAAPLAPAPVMAQTIDWNGSVDSDAGTDANWDGGTAPGAADDVLIDAPPAGSFDVIVSGAGAVASVQVDNGHLQVAGGGSLDVTGDATVRHTGALTVDATGTLTVGGMLTVTSTPFVLNGAFNGNATINGTGSMQVGGAGVMTGDLTMAGVNPTVTVDAGGMIDGNALVHRGTLNLNGELTGDLSTVGGHATVVVNVGATGVVGGMTSIEAGVLNMDGTLNGGLEALNGSMVNVSATGTINGGATVLLGTLNLAAGSEVNGTLTLNGGQNGGVVNASGLINDMVVVNGGQFNLMGGTIDDSVTITDGEFNADGTITGTVSNAGGEFTTTAATSITGLFTNMGLLNVFAGDLTLAGGLDNQGITLINDGRTLIGDVTNSGIISIDGAAAGSIVSTINGNVANAGGMMNLSNGVAGDSLVVNGNVTGSTTLRLDVNLVAPNGGFSDELTVSGTLDGTVLIEFDPIILNGVYTLQTNPILLIDAGAFGGSFDVSMVGLPTNTGLFLYSLLQDAGAADVFLQSEVNPAVGGIAAAMSQVSSMLGTVVNRPRNGAFVTGILYDTPNNCAAGAWARGIGGRASGDATTFNNAMTTITSSGLLNFGGLQAGLDFGCYDGAQGGSDIAAGITFGFNRGSGHQNAMGTTTAVSFDQAYFGLYTTIVNGAWAGDLQLRHQDTEFSFRNNSLNLFDQSDVSVRGMGFSGSLSYTHAMNNGWAVVPTLGLAITHSRAANLRFTAGNGAGSPVVGTLSLPAHTSRVGYVGATLAHTSVDEGSSTILSRFASLTFYNDFSANQVATFTSAGGAGTDTLTTMTAASYAEVSVGLAHVQVLGGSGARLRQVTSSIRGDLRWGSEVRAGSVSAQVRLNF